MSVLVVKKFAYNFIKYQLDGPRLTRMRGYLMFFLSMFKLIESLIKVPGIPVVTPHNYPPPPIIIIIVGENL